MVICRDCNKEAKASVNNPKLCSSCSDRVEAEIQALEDEDAAVCALADVADAAGIYCWINKPTHPHELRLPNEAFQQTIFAGFDAGVTDWETWAKTEGLQLLRKAMGL